MGLFNFSKKSMSPAIQDMIWMSQAAKLNGCKNLIRDLKDLVFVAWFPNTVDDFNNFLNEQNGLGVEILLARYNSTLQASGKKLILLEHYPLRNKEIEFITNANPQMTVILSSLDEPLFEQFGSEKIIQMMKNLGMKDDEVIMHPMITKAIEQAQKKIEKKVEFENAAKSSKEWFERNVI